MDEQRRLPTDPVAFVQDCVRRRQVLWTYHVNMRLAGRYIPREAILAAVETYELVEAYPDDKYLPSYLLLAQEGSDHFPAESRAGHCDRGGDGYSRGE